MNEGPIIQWLKQLDAGGQLSPHQWQRKEKGSSAPQPKLKPNVVKHMPPPALRALASTPDTV